MKYISNDKVFIDTNLWVYLSVSGKDEDKHNQAISFLESISDKNIYTSIQAINEFHWVLLRKYNFSEEEITEKVNKGITKVSQVLNISFLTYEKAMQLRANNSLSFWDSLMIASAILANCSIFYSEDVHHNLIIEDTTRILNPFI